MGAFEQLRQDGLRAMRRGTFQIAAGLFERAEHQTTSEVEKTRARIHRASAAIFAGEPSPLILELPRIVLRETDALNVWLSAFYYGNHLIDSNQHASAKKYLSAMVAQVPALDRPSYYTAVNFDFAYAIAMAERDFPKAYECSLRAREAVARCEPAEDVDVAAALIEHNFGYALLAVGRTAEAIEHMRAGLDALESLGAGVDRQPAYVNLAFAHLMTGGVAESEHYLDLLEPSIDAPAEWLRRYLLYLRAEIAQRRGDTEQAVRYREQLQQYYPEFRGLSEWLSCIDLLPVMVPERW